MSNYHQVIPSTLTTPCARPPRPFPVSVPALAGQEVVPSRTFGLGDEHLGQLGVDQPHDPHVQLFESLQHQESTFQIQEIQPKIQPKKCLAVDSRSSKMPVLKQLFGAKWLQSETPQHLSAIFPQKTWLDPPGGNIIFL